MHYDTILVDSCLSELISCLHTFLLAFDTNINLKYVIPDMNMFIGDKGVTH